MIVKIIFHSVCGNSYLVAKAYQLELKALGHTVSLLRVTDTDWNQKPGISDKVQALLQEMRLLPEAVPNDLVDADLIIMGSPVYFGNVSSEMKAFMDSTGKLWFEGTLAGKKFAAFASAGNSEGGGDLCLQALHTYAKYMGLIVIPLPVRILPGENSNALGVIQYSQGAYSEGLADKTSLMIRNYCSFLSRLISL